MRHSAYADYQLFRHNFQNTPGDHAVATNREASARAGGLQIKVGLDKWRLLKSARLRGAASLT